MMKQILLCCAAVTAMVIGLLPGMPVQAQGLSRTFVSGVGSDSNPCSRASPCLTWQGAIGKTAAGGEIDALDPGGFGPVTIDQSITLDGGGGQVAAVTLAAATNIYVNAGSNDVIILRNLRLNGLLGNGGNLNAGETGIYFQSGGFLSVENCTISGFDIYGIYAITSADATLNVTNTTITNVANGIVLEPTGGALYGEMDHTTIQKASIDGIRTNGSGGVVLTITNSNILNAAVSGVLAEPGTVLNIDSSSVSSNNTGFATTGGLIRISRNVIYDNNVNYSISGGGTIATTGDNIVAVNGATVPNGSVTVE